MESTTAPPSGTVTFLFTDIEGSTRLWEEQPEAMQTALARHDALLRAAIEAHGGYVFKTIGDQFCAAFATPPEAIAAALEAQRALHAEECGEVGSLRVRMAVNTGAVEQRGGDYFGPPLNRVARLLTAGHGGQVLLSQATSDVVWEALPPKMSLRDLGAHRLKDLQQPEHVFQLLSEDLPTDFPPLRSLEAFTHNLPAQLTSFIGREREMAEVKQFLATTRLLTLTGSGGCGKTRLALQVAADLLEEYADGVWLVELAPLADPALVPQAVAAALGLREELGRSLTATLTDYLRRRQVLLILDNCEHLLTGSAQLADALLRSCPSLRLLASSREGLGIGGEQTYRVPSLTLPDARHLPPLERLHAFEAVQLFADRARLSQATFAVTPANALSVAQVCERLDGIPLAIELAAARVKALPVEKLNERLDDMFRLLTGGSRSALPRQQTLRALIDWSYALLSDPERALLRRLSVFAGGWTLEAAEAVCAGEGVEEWKVLDLLTSLVEKSLVLYEEECGEGRYQLLETVRQYARDRLLESGEAIAVRDRHRDWFLALAEEAGPELEVSQQAEWLDRREREHDNFRAALEWSSAAREVEAGLRLARALLPFWEARNYWTEGREHLAGLLALTGAEERGVWRAEALYGTGRLARHQGDYGVARTLTEESLTIFRETGQNEYTAQALQLLANAAYWQGDYGTARAHAEESLATFRLLGHTEGIASSLSELGLVAAAQGDHGTARALQEESLATCRQLGYKPAIAVSFLRLGLIAHDQGDYEAARALLEESHAINQEVGSTDSIATALWALGMVARRRGCPDEARALLNGSLEIKRRLGERRGIAACCGELASLALGAGDHRAARAQFGESLAMANQIGFKGEIARDLEGLASVVAAEGQPERAAWLFGAADGLRDAIGAALTAADRANRDDCVAALRVALGEEAFAAAWAEGRAMSLDQAIHCALEAGGAEGRVPARSVGRVPPEGRVVGPVPGGST